MHTALIDRTIKRREAALSGATAWAVAYGPEALRRATDAQISAYRRLRSRCSLRGAILLSDDTLQVGFESVNGRDREAVIAPDGSRLETRNTYS